MLTVVLALLGYVLGSILFGEIIAKLKGIDIRKVGSGNVGATNVGRALGKKYALLVFILDMMKGFIPAYIGAYLFGISTFSFFIVALSPVVGHMFSIFSSLRGGKGVATAFGVLMAVSPKVALLSFLVWILSLYRWGYVSLSSILASASACLFLIVGGFPFWTVAMSLVILALIVYKHKSNIDRMLRGEEPKVR
jgi:glycerol-3-phosphate acyltransferase PlsY